MPTQILGHTLSGWPAGARAICRRERAHRGAQLSLIDTDGWRHQVFMTDQQGTDIAQLDLTHRGHARVEDRIRNGKHTGLENLPFREFAHNEVWLELCLIAQDLVAWTKTLTLEGELATLTEERDSVAEELRQHAGAAALQKERDRVAGELADARSQRDLAVTERAALVNDFVKLLENSTQMWPGREPHAQPAGIALQQSYPCLPQAALAQTCV